MVSMTSQPLDLETLNAIATMVAQKRSVDAVLGTIVESLVEQLDVALSRVWLVRPGDICTVCRMRDECPDRSRCLHLVATAHQQRNPDSGDEWHRKDGFYRRFPLGIRRIGWIAKEGQSLHLSDTAEDDEWFARSDWLHKEGVRSFAGHPLVFDDEILGVLAVFSRCPLNEREFAWLRGFADHAAVAISNARAFEEIQELRRQLELENAYLRDAVDNEGTFGDVVGQSAQIKIIQDQVQLVAPTDAAVLILGESGTGKELIAREVHRLSTRKDGPLIRVNCAAIPRELYESEFFGHAKGAFSGAIRDRPGRFEAANNGTLFLDEIGEIPLDLQSKLLRVLQEGTFERVGEHQVRRVDVRIIAATNRNLEAEVSAGNFRQDLYYRLNVFPIRVPSLRERVDDIPLLAEHLVELICRKLNRPLPRLTTANVNTLQAYEWPGNVRELQNVIERAVIVGKGDKLSFDLPNAIMNATAAEDNPPENRVPRILTDGELRQLEKDNLAAALAQTDGKIYGPDGAASLLGLNPTTLASRLKKLGFKRPRDDA